MNRLYQYSHYLGKRDLILKQRYKNSSELPTLGKVVIHSGLALPDNAALLPTLTALELVCGQKVVLTRAKKSIAQLKLREGNIVGCKSTLRDEKLFRFLELFFVFFLPRVRDDLDLKGYNAFGQFSFGFTNYFLFPQLETHYDFFENLHGFQATVVFQKSKHRSAKESIMYLSTFQCLAPQRV